MSKQRPAHASAVHRPLYLERAGSEQAASSPAQTDPLDQRLDKPAQRAHAALVVQAAAKVARACRPKVVAGLAQPRPQLALKEGLKVGVAPLAKHGPDVLIVELLDGHLLELQQGRLGGVAVDRDDLLGAMDEEVEGVAATRGERQAHVFAVDVEDLRARLDINGQPLEVV